MIDNPVLHKELVLRLRVRHPKPVVVGGSLALLVLVGGLYWYVGVKWLLADPKPDTGRGAWSLLIVLQYILICLVAPVITANSITQEKEQQTWEMLLFTPLRPQEIILGKLVARMATVLVLFVVFLPLVLLSWSHANLVGFGSSGYISLGQFCIAYVVMFVSALFFATIGLWMSWLFKRTLYAIMLAYTVVIGGLCIGSGIVTWVLSALFSDPNFVDKSPLMWVNPFMLMVWVLSPGDTPNSSLYLSYGLLSYAGLTFLMLWRMIAGFYRFLYE